MLGISIYPYKEKEAETLAYIDLAAEHGFGRVFTNLLMLEPGQEEKIIKTMKTAILRAREHQMEVILDMNPAVFGQLGVSYDDLSFFKEMGATGIRLDSTFDGMVESLMTFDKSGLDLEINISNDTYYLENILAYQPNKKKIIGCHNFYPQRFTGLDYDYFMKCSKKYQEMGIRTAAFINSQTAEHGPHPHTDGLCTLEMHRDLDSITQAKHLIATGLIDDIIVANSFASKEELVALSQLNQDQIQLDVVFSENVTSQEKEVVLAHQHFNRGDINSYSVRSTFVKLAYQTTEIPANNCEKVVDYGDITVGNSTFGQYKGELNIVKQKMPNLEGYKNVVAKISEKEQFLIPYIKPWTKFIFREE
ncbi:DUF871 domain-containing protein [Carnobacterium maltaromaticum]|uniref:DUF871 domain-containing protein n=1 Tax=Carnobacterium maltaromaticum TaxID=2751 RepID=UPI00295F4BED|nr:MupG family TIM beta-alpha barrel fold protein [Carnobacterium maltaromaticum]